jgi:hypothetical protein
MTTYFSWVKAGEVYDPQIHAQHDLDILKLTIDHREGEAALAEVVVAAVVLPPLDQRHVFISHDQTLIFAGRLVGLPLKIANDLISLELTAEPLDAEAQLQILAAHLKQPPYWDPLFVDLLEQDNPSEWLEGRSALYAWDRVTGKVCVSDLFQGRHLLDLTPVIFSDSLTVTLGETPLSHITVHLAVEWIQEAEGEVSLGPKIAAAFSGSMVNTLTPHALQATWPQEGRKIGRSGYWVVESSLKTMTPPKTGVLNIYPTVTSDFAVGEEGGQSPGFGRLRRFWMSAKLILGWRYRQKRREVVSFTLTQRTQLDGTIRPLSRTLTLNLQQLDLPQSAGTVFLDIRGRQAVEHALERARAHLAASARCLEVEMMLPFEEGLTLSLDHSVQLTDERIPGGQVMGKVVAYQLYQDGFRAYAWVRLAASVGGEPDAPPLDAPVYYVEPSYGDTAMPTHHQTASGLTYGDYADQKPTQGIVDMDHLSARHLVRQVFVAHDASSQIQALYRQQYPVSHNLKSVLQDIPTTISLDLLSLKTNAVAEHHIHLNGVGVWVAPKQLNL